MHNSFTLSGNIVDLIQDEIYPGTLYIENNHIQRIERTPNATYTTYISPGLVDAHVHIESSMLPPSEFARASCIHGTVATVSDPHEIANVLGIEGVNWMLADGKKCPFKFYFGAPSCVPATPFETAGAHFGPEEVESLLSNPEIVYLAEVMNFPAVIARDPHMMSIIEVAKRLNKHIDGHSPALIGDALKQYASAGIETDHECVTLQEGQERIALGMKVAIREGSAAKNFEALWPLVQSNPESVFLCSDDKHPDDLVVSHVNALVARLVAHGIPVLTAFKTASLNPIQHYGLKVGCLQVGDPADMVEWADLTHFKALNTWIDGNHVANSGTTSLERIHVTPINNFDTTLKNENDFVLPHKGETELRVITALDGQLITGERSVTPKVESGQIVADPLNDILKIVVVNRYQNTPPAIAFIQNFGLKNGAMASSVAHDSHNIVAVGTNDASICQAVNHVIESQGGLSAVCDEQTKTLSLPIAGLMSTDTAWENAEAFETLTEMVKNNGCLLTSPFMTLSFMALLVIPKLKLGDKGLFDVDTFSLIE